MSFGELLRDWRTRRGYSQMRLAMDAEVSTRHLSCLERNKANPSREMVLVLGSALELPLRERNDLLAAAGFVAAYSESAYESEPMAPIRQAIDLILAAHDPFPAIVVDRSWRVRQVNGGAAQLFTRLLGHLPSPGMNAMEALFDPAALRSTVVNLDEVGHAVIARLVEDARRDQVVAELLERLESRGWLDAAWRRPGPAPTILVPLHFRGAGIEARLFTTLTTLGTPRDVSAQELRIESYHPMDESTATALRSLQDSAVV